jgi:hypothetical protein
VAYFFTAAFQMRSMLLQLGLLTLLTAPVWAQQPALPGAPQPSTMPSPSGNTPAPTPLPAPSVAGPRQEIIEQMYSVELRSGTNFLGTLQAATAQDLTFVTKDLGTVTVLRTNLRQLTLLTPKQASLGFDNVGNGTRLFFAPTARNLRKGEGYVQDIDIVLLGINYGITDNFSIGVLVPIVPGLGLNVFALTPKLSIPVNDKLAFGVGTLFAVVDGSTGGIAYSVATYGSADNNVTAGLGYAFAGGEFSSTPVAVVGGAVRIARRISLIDETYIADGGVGGLLGVRAAASRVSGSLGFLYASGLGQIYPAYLDFVYRFGKVK